jgi:hypothetical protein
VKGVGSGTRRRRAPPRSGRSSTGSSPSCPTPTPGRPSGRTEARYALFTGRDLEERRAAALARVDGALAALEANPATADRAALMAAVVDTPVALMGHLGRAFHAGDRARRALIVELMTRRYYRAHKLAEPCALEVDGHTCTC